MTRNHKFWICFGMAMIDLALAAFAHFCLPYADGLREDIRNLFLVSGACFAVGVFINYDLWTVS